MASLSVPAMEQAPCSPRRWTSLGLRPLACSRPSGMSLASAMFSELLHVDESTASAMLSELDEASAGAAAHSKRGPILAKGAGQDQSTDDTSAPNFAPALAILAPQARSSSGTYRRPRQMAGLVIQVALVYAPEESEAASPPSPAGKQGSRCTTPCSPLSSFSGLRSPRNSFSGRRSSQGDKLPCLTPKEQLVQNPTSFGGCEARAWSRIGRACGA